MKPKIRHAAAALFLLAVSGAHAAWVKAGSAPLEMALEAIVPHPYKIELRGDIPPGAVVAWPQGDNWMEVLRAAVAPLGLTASHDLARNTVVVSPSPASAPPGSRIERAPTPEASAPDLAPKAHAAANPVWAVAPGALLRATLREWADRSGWSLVWAAGDDIDFRFEAGNAFQMDFKSAVRALFDSMPPGLQIRAELRPDNVPPLIYITRNEGGR